MKNLICLLIIGLSFFPLLSQNRVDKSELKTKKKRVVDYANVNPNQYKSGYIYLLDGKKYNGIIFENWDNGNLKEEFEVKKGLKIGGTTRSFDSIGNVKVDETQIGEYVLGYLKNGQIWATKTILSTEREGNRLTMIKTYFSNGNINSIRSYKDFKPHGRHVSYDGDGRLVSEYNYKDGLSHDLQPVYSDYGGAEKTPYSYGKARVKSVCPFPTFEISLNNPAPMQKQKKTE